MATAHGPGATAHRWPARLVRLAARALPRGPLRERYRQELLADLALVDHRGRFALQVLLQVPHLRRATAHTTDSPLGDIVASTKPFLCRTASTTAGSSPRPATARSTSAAPSA